jgi:PAS domain S-box-containing protein
MPQGPSNSPLFGDWWRVTLASVGDAVIATDATGKIVFMNPMAESLTAWTQREAVGQPLEEVFVIVNEQTRGEVQNPVQKVLQTGLVMGLGNHTVLISRDGRALLSHRFMVRALPNLDRRGFQRLSRC